MTYAAEVLADSPLLYWSFNSGGTDVSGNGRNSTGGTAGSSVAGLLPSTSDLAVQFNGSSQYFNLTNAAWMNTTSITLEVWVDTTTAVQSILASRDDGGRAWQFRLTAGKVEFVRISNSAGSISVITAASVTSVNDGNPHHVVATYDGTTCLIYIDGVLDSTTAMTGGLYAAGGSGLHVARYHTASLYYAGILDELAWYGTVLSAGRITAHYTAGVTVAVAGDAFASAATMLDGTIEVPVLIAGEATVSAATMLDGSIADPPIDIAGEAFVSSATMLDGSLDDGSFGSDAFADAEPIVLTADEYTSSAVDLTSATQEDGETSLPSHRDANEQSVWWTYTPTVRTLMTLDLTGSSGPGKLMMQVFTGTEIDDLVLVADGPGTDDDPFPTLTDVVMEADVQYWVYVVPRGTETAGWEAVLHAVAVAAPTGDVQSDPTGLMGLEVSEEIDLTGSTLDDGETYPATVVGTSWLSWTAPDEPPAMMRATLSNPDLTLTIWEPDGAGGWDVVDSVDPSVDMVPADLTWAPTAGVEYLFQIGMRTGDDPETTFDLYDASIPEYDEPAGAVEIDDIYGTTDFSTRNCTAGPEDEPGSTTQTAWVVFTASFDGVMHLQVDRTETDGAAWGVTVNDGALAEIDEILALATETTLSFDIEVTDGDVFYVQVGTGSGADITVRWSRDADLVDPEPPFEYLRVIVYEKDGTTPITEVPRRFRCVGGDALNQVDMGSLTIRLPEVLTDAYPNLFGWRNVVKFWLGERCISAFRIRKRRTVVVSTDEYQGLVRVVSGPTLLNMLSDMIVKHDGPFRIKAGDQRFYGWAAIADEWYDADDWDHAISSRTLRDPPGDWGLPAKERAKFNNPPDWPDRGARWLYAPSSQKMAHYRQVFRLTKATHVRIMATADERVVVYLDSEQVLEQDSVETGYTSYAKYDVTLPKGLHTLAVYRESTKDTASGDGNDSVLWTVMRVGKNGKPTTVVCHSVGSSSVKVRYGFPPGWHRGQILRSLMREARARGVSAAYYLTENWTSTHDSYGRPWVDKFNDNVSVGITGLDLQAQLSENGGFDVWVNPETLALGAARRRGQDKSKSITLEPGRNLIDYSVDEEEEVVNDFYIAYDGGWTRYEAKDSISKYDRTEGYVSLGNSKKADQARNLMKKASLGIADAVRRAGGAKERVRKQNQPDGSLIAIPGCRPFLDFGVGDTVKAPNENGVLTPHRVMALSFTEDEHGRLTYDTDLEEVR